jgi:hypothetical protein
MQYVSTSPTLQFFADKPKKELRIVSFIVPYRGQREVFYGILILYYKTSQIGTHSTLRNRASSGKKVSVVLNELRSLLLLPR